MDTLQPIRSPHTVLVGSSHFGSSASSIQTLCTIPIPVEFDRSMSVSLSSNPTADVDMRVSSKRGIVEVESEQSVEEVLEAGRSKASGSIFLGVDAN